MGMMLLQRSLAKNERSIPYLNIPAHLSTVSMRRFAVSKNECGSSMLLAEWSKAGNGVKNMICDDRRKKTKITGMSMKIMWSRLER